MQIIKEKIDLINKCRQFAESKAKISFVPTMGALHEGHLALIKEAKKHAEIIILSIFVNPKQFNNLDDFNKYPSNQINDIKLLEEFDIDILYLPNSDSFYNKNLNFNIDIAHQTKILCGINRPSHFNGVCLVLVKLLNLISPNFIFMGKKDYQQLQIVKNLIDEFDFQTKLIAVETIRLESGLAFSSRNNRLTENAKKNIAPKLYEIMLMIKNEIHNNPIIDIQTLKSEYKLKILAAGFHKIDYLEFYDNDLSEFDLKIKQGRVFIAAYIENVRLIDNLAI